MYSNPDVLMNILAFDTTHGTCSVAIAKAGHIITSETLSEPSKQAEQLLPIVERLLDSTELSYNDITHIATTTGPGSFTGIRIGLAAARGMLLATNATFVGISGLESLAWQGLQQNDIAPIYAILDARRGEVYLQGFDLALQPIADAILCSYEEAASHINENASLIGNSVSLVTPQLKTIYSIIDDKALPHADTIALLAHAKIEAGDEGLPASPLYIRKPDAKPSVNI